MSSLDEGELQFLVDLLQQVALGDASTQSHTTQQLMHFTAMPRSFYCLGHVFLDDRPTPSYLSQINPMLVEAVRGMSGLVLKNWIKQNRRDFTSQQILFLRDGLLHALRSPLAMVRSTAGSILTTIVSVTGGSVLEDGTGCWPTMLSDLCKVGNSAAYEAVEMIVEDNVECLVHGYEHVTEELVGHLVQVLCESNENGSLKRIILALCHFIPFGPESLSTSLGRVMEGLSRLGDRPFLQRTICQTLNSLLNFYPDPMLPYIPPLLQYTFNVMSQGDSSHDNAALEATEFWLTLADQDMLGLSSGELEGVVSCLLRNMRYTEDAPEVAEQDCSIEDGEDRDTDIMPRHHRKQGGDLGEEGEVEEGEDNSHNSQNSRNENENDMDWSLRKCSAATLDCISNCPTIDLLPILLPQIQSLFGSDWRDIEVAILALGAIAEGQRDAMETHLPSLLPYLLNQMRGHEKPLVRTIATWTVSRYSWFLVTPRYRTLGQSVLEGVLYGMISPNKLVQKASCTAMIKYIEAAEQLVGPVTPALGHAVKCALKTYHKKNLVLLYELIRTLADSMPDLISDCMDSEVLVVLMGHWERTDPDDSSMFPLLEALASLALSVGSVFGPIAPLALDRSLSMIDSILLEARHEVIDDQLYDMAIVAMDLIGGLACGLGETREMQQLLEGRKFAVQSVIVRGLHEPVTQVRQSVFALIGDLASHSCSHIFDEACLSVIRTCIVENMRPTDEVGTATASNAVWAAGELALVRPTDLLDLMEQMLPRLVHILTYEEKQQTRAPSMYTYIDNTVVCIGRLIGSLSNLQSAGFQALVESFPFGFWCHRVTCITDPHERRTCLIPICTLFTEGRASASRIQAQALAKMVSALQTQLEPSDELFMHLAGLSSLISSHYPNL